MRINTQLWEDFEYLWDKNAHGYTLTKEFRFHADRRWRFDYVVNVIKPLIAIEIEGGVWSKGGGRHNRPIGFINDCEKYNEAALMGWKVIRITEFGNSRAKTNEIIEKLILKIKNYLDNNINCDII